MNDARQTGFGSRATLALLVVGALLVCHGLLGASHVLAHGEPTAPEQPAAGHASAATHSVGHAAVGHGAGDGAPGAHVGATEYFAVLIFLAGVALLGALLSAGRLPVGNGSPGVLAPRRWFERRPLSRGHSPPFLQVFRL